ncbi:hypothetical protein SLEP1_g49902 [Rubroshorea leprosula]|uniref:Uncharacterized protein n=1 Tax=Rubroshorea leprosula TaxID=152421 RepID=A0AAV5M0T4_9ROSI|nr:hypothetical protein SLEP1_g49902 [Rubroshorea leprosula]
MKRLGNLTPNDFVKHCGREGNRKWKSHIWLPIGEDKVPLGKSPILKYYKFASNRANAIRKRNVFHRDEFINCHACNKPRRFSQRTEEERRHYHAATTSTRWRCSDWLYGEINCNEEAERESRRSLRGCPEAPACKGCHRCVCFGCVECRFNDCGCRICVDFIRNAEP